jgi:hypothetical protein
MANHLPQRELLDAVEAALHEQSAAGRYQRSQRDATSRRDAVPGARPLEFDESGFPIPQRSPSFVKRVAQLLSVFY